MSTRCGTGPCPWPTPWDWAACRRPAPNRLRSRGRSRLRTQPPARKQAGSGWVQGGETHPQQGLSPTGEKNEELAPGKGGGPPAAQKAEWNGRDHDHEKPVVGESGGVGRGWQHHIAEKVHEEVEHRGD